MSAFSSWRTALRIARREARRSKGRSALVVLMIALPVAALAGFASAYDMFTLTPAERADRVMGQSDAVMIWPSHHPVDQLPEGIDGGYGMQGTPAKDGEESPADKPGTKAELAAALPAGSQVLEVQQSSLIMTTTAGIGRVNAIITDGANPAAAGYLSIVEGRAPAATTEVALTGKAATRLGASVGSKVTTSDAKSFTVVGLVEFPWDLGERMLFAPGAIALPDYQLPSWFVTTAAPIDWTEVRRLNTLGIVVTSRQVLLDPPPADQVQMPAGGFEVNEEELAFTVLIAGLALLEIVLMAGPAFAVSARRRQRQLALVAANGGTPAHIRRIVLADGVVLGAAGAVVGIVLGLAIAFLAKPFAEELLFQRRGGAFRVFPLALLAIAVLAIITGLLAALVPAFITARLNVVQSLAGRRGVTRSRKRWLALGLAGVALGSAIVVYATTPLNQTVMLAGMVIGELGLVLCTPALVGLIARIGRVLPLAPRIALRDAARNRAAAAPAISAVMAAVAGSVALGLIITSQISREIESYQPGLPTGYVAVYLPDPRFGGGNDPNSAPASFSQVGTVLRGALPIADVVQLHGIGCTSQNWCDLQPRVAPGKVCSYSVISQNRQLTKEEIAAARVDPKCADILDRVQVSGVLVDDGTNLGAFTNATGADLAAAVATLKAGGIVVPGEEYLDNGQAQLAVINVDTSNGFSGDPADTAPRQTYPAHHLSTGVLRYVVVPPAVVQAAGLIETPGLAVGLTTRVPTTAEEDKVNQMLEALRVYGQIERGAPVETPGELWLLMAAAAIIALAAAAVGTALAAADGRADLSTLAAVGASPRLRRGLSLSQSAVIAGLGSVLGAIAGLGAALAVIAAINFEYVNAWPATLWVVRIPWLSLIVALLVVPAIAMLGAGLLTRSRLPIERRI